MDAVSRTTTLHEAPRRHVWKDWLASLDDLQFVEISTVGIQRVLWGFIRIHGSIKGSRTAPNDVDTWDQLRAPFEFEYEKYQHEAGSSTTHA